MGEKKNKFVRPVGELKNNRGMGEVSHTMILLDFHKKSQGFQLLLKKEGPWKLLFLAPFPACPHLHILQCTFGWLPDAF